MKNISIISVCFPFLALLFGLPALAGNLPASDRLPAFPGAEGFGRYAAGGRGGRVYHVTTLVDGKQPGTLRYAVSQKGARTVVFDVAGTIFLNSPLRIVNDSITIAGQTAPGQGVCIARHPVNVAADNVILRYLRFRVGNEGGGEPDGLSGYDHRNIIVDHCSISWSVDEACSIYGNTDATVQWCLISESLRTAGHRKGRHGYGAIVGGRRMSFHHNLLAHHESRAPRLGARPGTQTEELVDMRCNVFYNWAGNGCYGGEGMCVNIVNNYYKPGPATPRGKAIAHRIFAPSIRTMKYCHRADGSPNGWAPMEHVWGKFYVAGNVMEGDSETTADNWTRGIYEQVNAAANDGCWNEAVRDSIRLRSPLPYADVTTHTAQDAFRLVLADAGCSKKRDAVDSRIVEETRTGTATYVGSVTPDASSRRGLIDLPADVGGYPFLAATVEEISALRDTDGDGMPDAWEQAHGLDPDYAGDGNISTLSRAGYTNLEVYLDEAARPHGASSSI